MKQPEQEGTRWLAQARDDLRFVRWLAQEGQFFDKGCFVAQQAAEKALKALLYRHGARTVLGHSVLELVERAVHLSPAVEELREGARLLDRFYIPTRYPNGLPGGAPFESFTSSDLAQAAELAGRIVEKIGEILDRKGAF